jgi:arginyl-tRNA synthetase
MTITGQLKGNVLTALEKIYQQAFTEKDFQLNQTKPEFEGDYTVVLFSLVKSLKKSPEAIGNELGGYLVQNYPTLYTRYNIIKGFLNLTVTDSYWLQLLQTKYADVCYGKQPLNGQKVMVEYSSPNTNKPLWPKS